MEITVREEGTLAIFELKGRLDMNSGTALKEQIKKMHSKQMISVHLNLAGVEFINSSGLGALVSIMKETRVRKGRLTLSNLATYVQEIFEITQLSHIFEIFPTEADAQASYQAMVAH